MRTVQVEMSDQQVRAGARVLGYLLNHDHPVVQKAVTSALAELGKHEALGCAQRMYGALLAEAEPSWKDRLHAWWKGFLERNWSAEDPSGNYR